MNELNDHIQKLDLSEPGVFILKSNVVLSLDQAKAIRDQLGEVIKGFSPESQVLILPPCFDSIEIINVAQMEKLGWVRKEKE